jgi:hydrogenase nickel incorporation protein HypB
MCATCGCEGVDHDHDHDHDRDQEAHDHGDHQHDATAGRHHHAVEHAGDAAPAERRENVSFEQALLEKNARFAGENRRWFGARGVFAVNLMSSPGAGKTTLLERLIAGLKDTVGLYVIEGDQATDNDARRIRAAGARAVQINTGAGCHLDAHRVGHAAEELAPERGGLVLIENVGNLVCPALFDLGEAARIVVVSVTEGEDKPLKYPHMFRASDVLIVSKIDLLPYVACDLERLIENARRVKPGLRVFRLSATSGAGLDELSAWFRREAAAAALRPAQAGRAAAT